MSSHVPPTPHELAKGSKEFHGLSKLKYYCQLCKKQCPDKNGFNCHLVSNTHLMHMRLFKENPEKYIDDYSREFEETYLDILKKKYNGKSVLANQVYQDHIRNPAHTHMNATRWATLTSFIDSLKETGKVETEWTSEGLFIKHADISVEAAAKKKEEDRKIAAKLKKEEKEKQAMDQQMELVKRIQEENKQKEEEEIEATPIDISQNHKQISFSFAAPIKPLNNPLKAAASKPSLQPNIVISLGPQKSLDSIDSHNEPEFNQEGKRKPVSALEKVLGDAKLKKVKTETTPVTAQSKGKEEPEDDAFSWVTPGIVVKIKDKELEKYYNQKGKIIDVPAEFTAQVEMLSNKAKLQIDQDLLETVIPAIGNPVKVLKKGPFFGKAALLESIHQDNFTASVLIEESDTALELPYEMISKAVS